MSKSHLQPEEMALTEDSRRQMAVINRYSHQVISSLSIHDVIQSGLEGIIEVIHPDLALFFMRDGDKLKLEGFLADTKSCQIESIPVHQVGECLCGLAVVQGTPIYSSDITIDPRCTMHECKQAGLKTFAALPLIFSGQVLGVLGLANCHREGGDFKPQSEFLEILANYMAIAIKNALFIEELKSSVAEIKRAKDEWEGIFQAIGDPITVIDAENHILNANRAALSLIKKDLAEIRGRYCYEVFHGTHEPPLDCPHLTLLKTHRPQGRIMPVEVLGRELLVSLSPVCDADGQLASVIHYGRDVTDLRQFEKEREALINELEQKNSNLEQFVYMASHDLKTPLVGINGFIGLLEKDLKAGEYDAVERDMKYIRQSAMHMYDLLNDLLQYSRLGYIESVPENIELKSLVQEVLDVINQGVQLENTEITIADNMPVLHGDRLRFAQLFQNLISNAIKFSTGCSPIKVEIGWKPQNESPVFFVRDYGAGIAAEYTHKIFELFHQLDPEIEGTGVGLTIAKRIVEMNGGNIWVESAGIGQGSTFCFSLGKQCFRE